MRANIEPFFIGSKKTNKLLLNCCNKQNL